MPNMASGTPANKTSAEPVSPVNTSIAIGFSKPVRKLAFAHLSLFSSVSCFLNTDIGCVVSVMAKVWVGVKNAANTINQKLM